MHNIFIQNLMIRLSKDQVFGRPCLWKTRSLEDPVFGRPGLWKTRSLEDPVCGRPCLWKTRSLEDPVSGRPGLWKTRSLEDPVSGRPGLWKTRSLETKFWNFLSPVTCPSNIWFPIYSSKSKSNQAQITYPNLSAQHFHTKLDD